MAEQIVIGFDFGMKRIGVALGNVLLNTARPLSTLAAVDGVPHWQEIEKIIKEWGATALIVGIPLNMDGSEQTITFAARKFAHKLKQKFKLPIHCIDERLSTVAARQHLFDAGGYRKLKQAEVDSFAAKIIVEQWLFNTSMEPKS